MAQARNVGNSTELDACHKTLETLGIAVEVHSGFIRNDGITNKDGLVIMDVTFCLGKSAPETKAKIINGLLFVSALDAGAMTQRERARLLAVARRVNNSN